MFKELYNKTIKLAGHKKSKSILGFISFIESFIFPIPPDVLIIPMTIAKKKRLVEDCFNSYNFLSAWWMFGLFHWLCFF